MTDQADVILLEPYFVTRPETHSITEGNVATFNCTGSARGSQWLVNGEPPEAPLNSQRGLQTAHQTLAFPYLNEHLLLVPGELLNDDINVTCILSGGCQFPEISHSARLHVNVSTTTPVPVTSSTQGTAISSVSTIIDFTTPTKTLSATLSVTTPTQNTADPTPTLTASITTPS